MGTTTNKGKQFEKYFKESVPDFCFCHRLKDTAQSYNKSKDTKFTWDNPCDYYLFNGKSRTFYALELKSTKYKQIAFDRELDRNSTKMIKYHQIKSLIDFTKYDGVISGFVFNFRDEENCTERAYFQKIEDFIMMTRRIRKKSFNEVDLTMYNAIKINGEKKRVHYKWNIAELLKKVEGKQNG